MSFRWSFGWSRSTIPVGAIVSIVVFIWTVETDFWRHLNWVSAPLFGLALLFIFFWGIDYHQVVTYSR
jgi:hypothetical protein